MSAPASKPSELERRSDVVDGEDPDEAIALDHEASVDAALLECSEHSRAGEVRFAGEGETKADAQLLSRDGHR